VPHEYDPAAEPLVRGVQEGGKVALTETLLLASAAGVNHELVDEPGALAWSAVDQASQ
jgi:hypothetical protein